MHEYSLSHHDRKVIYYLIALLSSLAGIVLGFVVDVLRSNWGIVVAAPSGLAVFGLLYLLFDHFVWKWPAFYDLGFIKIPNLNGDWSAAIASSATGEEVMANVRIHQTYSKIRIHLDTDKSASLSQMAAIEMASPTLFNLRYEYSAEFQRNEAAEIIRHYGVTNVRLKSEDHKFSEQHAAIYYTEQGRDSHGRITFTRTVKNEG